ncbi:MAG: carbohydrate kinase family protein [Dermatophilaceae bacterium]
MTRPALDVVVVGNVGIDTNVYLPGADVDWSREANFTENRDYVGQAGGYAARGYAQLGWRTGFIGTVGDDWAGAMVRAELEHDGIDLHGLWVDPVGTARSVNVMGTDGSRKNFYDGAGHLNATPPDAAYEVVRSARLVHVNIANWARLLLPAARSGGAVVAVDLQDLADPRDAYRADFVVAADVAFFSAANVGGPRLVAEALRDVNPGLLVVVGMGAQGCGVADAQGWRTYPAPPSDLAVVDTNGAGDALAVGVLTSHVLQGLSLEQSVLRGQVAARWCAAQRASTSTLITRDDLDRLSGTAEGGGPRGSSPA